MKMLLTTAVALLLVACNDRMTVTVSENDGTLPDDNMYSQAVNHEARSAADRERDAGRRPARVLEFFGIEPGMRVLDLYSGGGYYSEIIARLVGSSGQISAHNNAAYRDFVGDELKVRYADDRLTNITHLDAENNELELPANYYDAITMMLVYHDVYFVDTENGWPQIDGPALLAELFQGLKPGGIVGLVDHSAPQGAPPTTGGTIHRIDPAVVIEDMQNAGFVLDGEIDLLRNPDDDLEINVFDPAVRGTTDRFVLRFLKPE